MTRPPLLWLLAYRFFGLRLPAEYRPWVAKDVTTRYFLFWRIGRTVLWLWTFVGVYWATQREVYEPPERRTIIRMLLFTLAVALLSSGKALVRRTLRWQRVDRHGRPAPPRRLGVMSNVEVTLLAGSVVVVVVATMVLFAHGLKPRGPAGAPCRTPDEQTISLIRGGLKNASTELLHANAVRFQDATMVAAVVRQPGVAQDSAGVWVVEDGGDVFELRTPQQARQSATRFQPPANVDRLGVEALRRVVECLARDRGR